MLILNLIKINNQYSSLDMIYLMITTSLHNKFGLYNSELRQKQYIDSITSILYYLPTNIQPIIIENNGNQETFLDHFTHNHSKVPVFYTNNNKNDLDKGIIEILDIKQSLINFGILPSDTIIKITGRYKILSSDFFNDVIENELIYEAFIKYFNVCTLQYDKNDCVLGCYGIRAYYLLLWNHETIKNYKSTEIAFATYTRLICSTIKEYTNLNLECCFAEDNRILIV